MHFKRFRYDQNLNIICQRLLLTEKGDIAWASRLSTWGKATRYRLSANDDSLSCHLRFAGQYADEESGLHYNRHRYYDSETGQYLSPDPIGLAGGVNPYGYVHNPLNDIDPLGLAGKECCGDNLAPKSLHIDPRDIAGKTPAEIDQLARQNGLISKGPDPMMGRGAYVDSVTSYQRLLIHPDGPSPHSHVNNPMGERLDINGRVVPPESPDAHLGLTLP